MNLTSRMHKTQTTVHRQSVPSTTSWVHAVLPGAAVPSSAGQLLQSAPSAAPTAPSASRSPQEPLSGARPRGGHLTAPAPPPPVLHDPQHLDPPQQVSAPLDGRAEAPRGRRRHRLLLLLPAAGLAPRRHLHP